MIRRDIIVSEHEVSVEATIYQMKRLIDSYYTDVSGYGLTDLEAMFNFVKDIPYVKDVDQPDGNFAEEVVQRPELVIQNSGDCDDKTVLMASFLKNAGYQWRIVTVAFDPRTMEMVHTYCEVYLDGQWLPMDATYAENEIFVEQCYVKKKVW